MATPRPSRVLQWLRSGRERLLEAERRFFDAYNRGGACDPRSLVIPVDYFARPRVEGHLERWLAGRGALDLALLEEEWKAAARRGDARLFYRNLAHFLSLAQ